MNRKVKGEHHPQTNGLIESFNRTLKDTNIKECNDEQDDWDDFIDKGKV